MIFFADTMLKRYTPTTTQEDPYGEEVAAYEYAGDILVDFQEEDDSEKREAYAAEKEGLYVAYMDFSVDLDGKDILVDEEGYAYDITGDVQAYKHFIKYRKANLKRRRRDDTWQPQ